jgi:hypothetical protein
MNLTRFEESWNRDESRMTYGRDIAAVFWRDFGPPFRSVDSGQTPFVGMLFVASFGILRNIPYCPGHKASRSLPLYDILHT